MQYASRRADLRAELARLPQPEAHGRPEVLDRLESYLLNAAEAGADAASEQRNRLARSLFEAILVRDEHVTAVHPRPEFQPYFVISQETTATPAEDEASLSTDVRWGGLEGIRTPDLGLDRAAC